MPTHSANRRARRALEVLALAAIASAQQGCGSDGGDQIDNPPPGSIALAIAATMALAPGDSGVATVTITRSNISGDVALTVENLPAGATASFNPQSVSGSGSTLKVRTSASVASANYDLLIRGTASGGRTATATLALSVAVAPASSVTFKSVVAGSSASCALTTTGRAYCWGSNSVGQLGNGTTAAANPTPTAVAGGLTFESLSLPDDGRYACGLRADGAAYCWGFNAAGQIGDGTLETPRLTPTAVVGGLKFVSLAAGGLHTCGLTTDSVAYCWGDNAFGEFGDGSVKGGASPVLAAPGFRFKALAASDGYTCGLTPDGAAYCWGLNAGRLGNGGNTNTLTPLAVAGDHIFASISTGAFDACGTTATGEAYCWGYNSFGQVGDGTTIPRAVPTAVAGGVRFTSLRMGFEHVCGVTAGGTAYCWGLNDGALGDGTSTHRSMPTPVLGGLKFQSVSIADSHACGVTEIVGGTNDVYCWGDNAAGQLGDGTTTVSSVPRKVRWPQ